MGGEVHILIVPHNITFVRSRKIKFLEEEGVNFQMDIVVIQTNFWLNPTKGAHFDGEESNVIIDLSDSLIEHLLQKSCTKYNKHKVSV